MWLILTRFIKSLIIGCMLVVTINKKLDGTSR